MLERYLAVDKEGWFWLYRREPQWDKKNQRWNDPWGDADECLGRRTEKYEDLDLVPKPYRRMTWQDQPVKVWMEKKIKVFTEKQAY